MPALDIISVNIWQIIISLLNLVILFLIIKRFLYKPVQKMLAQRQAELDKKYSQAEEAKRHALEDEASWNTKMQSAKDEADSIVQRASDNAKVRSDRIVSEAKDKADSIVRQAEQQAQLEFLKAQEGIRREIVDVSTALTEKLLSREINTEDHQDIIDSVIEKIGDNNDRTD